ncbi:glycosyltransferase [Bacteroides caecigallinarum]|nr:glycosyltransferase [Bacteroides caecigallinarum]
MIDLSIIIPVYNGALLLSRCLDSIFAQNTQYSYEVILVDDGSTDNSVELIKARKETNIILYQQQNAGPAVARNKGVELANGKYCAYLDADDYWLPGFIERTILFLEEHKDCAAVNVAQHHLTVSGDYLLPACYTNYKRPFILEDFFSFWASYMHICTGSVVIRKEVIRAAGGMRNDLRITEDLEFWAMVSIYGRWGFIPEILFVSDGTDVTKSQGWLEKMQIRWKNAPSIANWEKRLITKLPKELPEGYKRARGVISRNLTYCQLLSGRLKLSRHEALLYGKYFIKDPIGKLMNMAKYTPLTWWMLAKFLKYREYHRKLN